MDVLLRQAVQSESASENSKSKIQNPKSSHLDADEISLFAENTLPKKLRENAVAHFADCDRCRKILSALILQNSENEIVSTKQIEVFAPVIPWYRKFLAFPNLAYTLGALVLIFSGIVAFTVLQSVNNSQNAEVSQVAEQPVRGGPFLDDTAIVEEQFANANMSGSMSNASMSNSSMSNAASVSSSNSMMSNASTDSAARSYNAALTSNSAAVSNKSNPSANESAKDEPRSEADAAGGIVTELPLQNRSVKNLTEDKTESAKGLVEEKTERAKRENKKDAEATEMAKAAPPPKPEQPSVSENEVTSSDASGAKSKKLARMQNVETTSVGGKTFRHASNGWVDSNYKGQPTINIRRGTNEFKKLDSGLREIAGSLSGTVIIVWKDKAYRIQ